MVGTGALAADWDPVSQEGAFLQDAAHSLHGVLEDGMNTNTVLVLIPVQYQY